MKKGLFIFLFAFGILQSFASVTTDAPSDSTKPRKKIHHYISLNTTFFIKQVFNLTGSTVSVISSPYLFEYKMLDGNNGFRFDLGGNIVQSKTFSDSNGVVLNDSTTLNLRAGYVYQKQLAKRWVFFTGADVIASVTNSLFRTNNTLDVTTDQGKAFSIGAGPSFGIQFNINNRVGLFTESAIYYSYSHQNQSFTSANFPELNTTTKVSGNNVQFLVPTSLYFFVKF